MLVSACGAVERAVAECATAVRGQASGERAASYASALARRRLGAEGRDAGVQAEGGLALVGQQTSTYDRHDIVT
jgi:hypothetical protein